MAEIPEEYLAFLNTVIKTIPFSPCQWNNYGDPDVGSVQEHLRFCYEFNCALDYCCLDLRRTEEYKMEYLLTLKDLQNFAANHYNNDWPLFIENMEAAIIDFEIHILAEF